MTQEFSGTVTIELDVRKKTNEIVLHSHLLSIKDVQIKLGNQTIISPVRNLL